MEICPEANEWVRAGGWRCEFEMGEHEREGWE